MSWVRDLLGVYGRVFRRAFQLTVTHWWVGLLAIGYQALMLVLALLLGPLGLVGGLLLTFAIAAIFSSWLVLVGNIVRSGRASLSDLRESFFVYLGDVLTFGFLLWALQYVASVAFADFMLVAIVFEFALLVFLSAVPEQIYLGGQSGAAVFVESYRFVGANWIEWLPATVLLIALTVLATLLPFFPLPLVAGGIAFTFMFVARGLLFIELNSSSRRARDFQRRAAG